MKTMSLDEKTQIALKSVELRNAGKKEEATELMKTLPLPPYLVKILVECFGAEAMRESGWDLSEAEAEYGKDWLK